jgi:hypothetical protein
LLSRREIASPYNAPRAREELLMER